MSRIRSIHPGLFTDEAFVVLSPMARLFFMGLWTECDDWGSFEWAPLKLKMRLLPADSVDAHELLAEIEAERGILKYEVNGKSYGAVRNFCQYQRPKKPNSAHPQTDAVRKWVNIEARQKRDGSEEVPNEFPTDGEIGRQMEDGGGNKEIPSEANASSGSNVDCGQSTLGPNDVIEAWNDVADDCGLPKIIKLTPERKRRLAQRLRENSFDEFAEALRAIRRSKFLRGDNPRGWRANFDFLLQPSSFTKLLEGYYDQTAH